MMTSLDDAPPGIRGWFAAEWAADQKAALAAVLAPTVVLEFPPVEVVGIEQVCDMVAMAMPAGWLGEVEWSVLTPDDEGWWTVRGTGPGGGPLTVWVPGAPSQTLNAMDLRFLLDDAGLITRAAGRAHHPEPAGLAAPLAPGASAPVVTLPDTTGADVSIGGPSDAVLAVVFISNHCPFSLGWHARLEKVARDYAARGVGFRYVNPSAPGASPADESEQSRARAAAGELSGPYLIDDRQIAARAWGARTTPEIFLLDTDGVLAYHGAPDADVFDDSLDAQWLRAAIDAVLDGRTPQPPTTEPVGCAIRWGADDVAG